MVGQSQLNSSVALERLRGLLREAGDLAEWRLPTERELAAELKVGRRAVRRALEVLQAEGRIWRQQGKGTFSGQRPSLAPELIGEVALGTNALEVMEARLAIEPALARRAALRSSAEGAEALAALAARTAAATDGDARELWDSALHRRIAEMGDNGFLVTIFDMMDRVRQNTGWRGIRDAVRSPDRHRTYVADHSAIVAAIADSDGEAAETAMRRHLERVAQNLRTAIGEHGGQGAAGPVREPSDGLDA